MVKKETFQPILFFLAKFFLIYIILYVLLLTIHAEPLQYAIAAIESHWTGLEQDGFLILLKTGESFLISEQCTGLVSAITLTALIWAGRKPSIRKKIILNAGGLLILLIINLVRIYAVIQVGQSSGMEMAELAHQTSWYAMTIIIIGLWYVGMTKWSGLPSIDKVA